MVRRHAPLSEHQLKVLSWVADGCPSGVWEGFSYKHTAYTLADRGLVTVDRRRHSWSTRITDSGRYYLVHGTYLPETAKAPRASRPRRSAAREPRRNHGADQRGSRHPVSEFELSPADLVTELQSRDESLTITNPAPGVRAGYRRAISRAVANGLVPEGYVLRYHGRDHGDLSIRLVARDDADQPPGPLDVIRVPESLEAAHDVVKAIRDRRPEVLDVDESSRSRALLILQAIAAECDRRGYEFGLARESNSTFQIGLGDIVFAFVMFEEYTRRVVPDPEQLATAKYEWQRVRSTVQQVRAGRLVIRLGDRYTSTSWADRKRWSLVDKLPELFAHVAQAAADIAERRAQAERARQERHRAWEAALVQARQDYITDLNRRRLDRQLTDTVHADDMRRYAAQVDQHAEDLGDAEAGRVLAWAAWIRVEADRIDPLHHPENLSIVEPEEVPARDLDPFMPKGMSALHPPL